MAAFGAVLSIFFGIADLQPWILPASGVAGAMVGMVALFLLAGVTASALTLVLSGVILSSIAVAGIALVLSLSPSPWAAGEIVRWLLGALADRSLDDLLISTPLIAIGAVLILGARRALDALTLGEAARARSASISAVRSGSWLAASAWSSARASQCPESSASSGSSCRICCGRWSSEAIALLIERSRRGARARGRRRGAIAAGRLGSAARCRCR